MGTVKSPAETVAWVRRFHPAPDAATRLVCFPHAGGAATFYFPVSRALSPTIDVLAIQYPGRMERRTEPCVDNVDELADLIAEQLGPWLDRPVTLFGHSLGATVGFEVARRLEAAGMKPLSLFASGRMAPSRYRDDRVHTYDDDTLIEQLGRLSGTDARVLGDEEMLRMILPTIRSDYRAVETYRMRPGPQLTCPITVLTGDNDPEVTLDEARAWAGHTSGRFELTVLPGGHFFLTDHITAVLAQLTAQVAARPSDLR
ncbi:thioesterase II family protein [Nocardia suismassiliense]|uniref:Thioesterase TesA n=1 Tax=Nocardia suismassiliense TaxID=2077092 RepID=A0ABW6R0L4_9NOCA